MNAQPVDDEEKDVEQELQPEWQWRQREWLPWQWRQWQWQQWQPWHPTAQNMCTEEAKHHDADAANDDGDFDSGSNSVKNYTNYTWSRRGLPKQSVPVHPEEHSQLPPLPPPPLPPPAHPPPPPPPSQLRGPEDSASSSQPPKSTEECIAELERRERLKQRQKVAKETETVDKAAVSVSSDASETESQDANETEMEVPVDAQHGKKKQKKPRKKRKRAGQNVQYYNHVYGKPWSAGFKKSRPPR